MISLYIIQHFLNAVENEIPVLTTHLVISLKTILQSNSF